MDRLPFEVLVEILDHLPLQSCKTARLTSRAINAVLSKRTFGLLVSFIDPQTAQATVAALAKDLRRRRRRSIWSPECSVPNGLRIPESFLLALWAGVRGEPWLPAGADTRLTVAALQQGLGRDDATEGVLREALFRYALYLSYLSRDDAVTPHAWVFDFRQHRHNKAHGVASAARQAQVSSHREGPSTGDLIRVKE
ncbi:hypothetical protein AK830_g11394 [Neonectria ditissima]|uniref:F-box domain-containing protein n=1 Tax=Neonectria ditissima TaxID=78410 RepID=A0A0P7B875_9HYPO|nr:hypothetical protein AK830_g11394 [Neonectria ditissima]